MRVCIGVFVIALLLGLTVLVRKGKFKNELQIKRAVVVCILFSGMGILAEHMQEKDALFEDGYLRRYENGMGSYETEVSLKVDGMEETTMNVLVPEQRLTREEEQYYLECTVEEIERALINKEIQDKLLIQERYQDGRVCAEWSFDKPKLVDQRGIIEETAFVSECERVKASVLLVCEDSNLIHEFYFTARRKEKSEEEIIYGKINEIISKNGEAEGTEKLLLPPTVEGRNVSWKIKKEDVSLQILFLGVVVLLFLPALEQQKKKEKERERKEHLLYEYPEMVNKLALLMGAGMSIQRAWERIVSNYQEARNKKEIPKSELYEEMLLTFREMKSGRGEISSYEAFGERCGLHRYRRFSNYLIQNLKKGSNRLKDFLWAEASEMFEERKNRAKQYGEELGTRLLMPMMLMLGIVIFIVMVPAWISFSTGI